MTAAEIARHLNGEVVGDGSVALRSFAPADSAKPGDLTFAENPEYFSKAEQSAASAVLVDKQTSSAKKTLIRVANPRAAFAKVLPLFFSEQTFAAGIHPTAIIAATAKVDATAHIGPNCVVGERARIGARSVLQGGDHLGADCALGEDVNLYPNVTIYPRSQIGSRVRVHAGVVIGSDGFGYVFDEGHHRKVMQVGSVVIGDDVEIGAGTTIDRGALGPTSIGKGTKIDNLVQIAHNVVIGQHCIICALSAFAGGVTLGDYVVIGGQAGISNRVKIGNRVTLAAKSGVMHDIPDGEKWWGTPAQPDKETKRQFLAQQKLPELLRRVAALEKERDK